MFLLITGQRSLQRYDFVMFVLVDQFSELSCVLLLGLGEMPKQNIMPSTGTTFVVPTAVAACLHSLIYR